MSDGGGKVIHVTNHEEFAATMERLEKEVKDNKKKIYCLFSGPSWCPGII